MSQRSRIKYVAPNEPITAGQFNQLVDTLNFLMQNLPAQVGGFPPIRQPNVLVKILSNAAGGEKYNAAIIGLPTLPIKPTTNVSSADIGDVPSGSFSSAIFSNFNTTGTATTHTLAVGSFVQGVAVGYTSETNSRVEVNSVERPYRTASPQSLAAGTGESAQTDSWDRTRVTSGSAYGDVPLTVQMVSRVVYNASGDQVLYQYTRNLTFDAGGKLITASAETRATVETPAACS